ncbi:MAG: 7,8-didemethyl-8-hydroxy-5-deazariboflavin synthase subunit CofH [Candidatus Actinomarinales bacterium]|nr:MAG: 7,8-didemethyl-8-hydroxy-5-deazariboflavin synthase subunit CofH [Candidatus Actinomarinales bacterium]|tara:strand:+ start:3157 stop:5025 length:1869 start_codon:yes stop_codon:yes gene_type:complete
MDIQKNTNMQNNISFLRIRPSENDNEIFLNSRKKEGTSSFLVKKQLNFYEINKKGFQTISNNSSYESSMWILNDNNWQQFQDKDSKRLIYSYKGKKEIGLEILTRLKPRTIQISNIEDINFINLYKPEYKHLISMYVDSNEDAIEAINYGINDLLLRDWNTEQIKELQSISKQNLYERTVLSPLLSIDEARRLLDKGQFTNYLLSRDVRGYRRKETDWYPGSGKEIPKLFNYIFNNEADYKSKNFDNIFQKLDDGEHINDEDLSELFKTSGKYINRISEFADNLNLKVNGNKVTFVKNRNINYTNQCYYKCGFCGFSKGPKSLDLKEIPYSLEPKEVVNRAKEAYENGASEVCLQGGIHPNYTGEFYINLVKEIKEVIPDMHIHGFTPLEIWQGAETINKSVEEYLVMLKEVGLNTLPGTAAEILDDRIRKFLCPDKITSKQWAYVMEVAHSLGIKSTATIMFGHIDDIESWTNHYSLIRNLQERTQGFTEIVPLPFVHMGSPIYLQGKSMPGPTWDEVLLIHSLARIYFHDYIDNIQASWVKLGHDGSLKLLEAGVNDLGGTLINENISRASGASHGQETTDLEFINLIEKANKKPYLRNTLYTKLKKLEYKNLEQDVIKI